MFTCVKADNSDICHQSFKTVLKTKDESKNFAFWESQVIHYLL